MVCFSLSILTSAGFLVASYYPILSDTVRLLPFCCRLLRYDKNGVFFAPILVSLSFTAIALVLLFLLHRLMRFILFFIFISIILYGEFYPFRLRLSYNDITICHFERNREI